MGRVVGVFLLVCVSVGATEVPEARQELRVWDEDRWAVVTVRQVMGEVVVVSPVVGREIDFEEGNQLAAFQGVTEFNKKHKIPTFTQMVSGFQSAVILKLEDDSYGICVTLRDEAGIRCRLLRIRDEKELGRIRDYIHDIQRKQRVDGYPKVTEEKAIFEVVSPAFRPDDRIDVKMALRDGEQVKGELLPVMEDGQMLIDTPLGFRRIGVGAVDQIRIGPRGGSQVVTKTIGGGVKYAILGGITGMMAGLFYQGASAKEELLFGAMVGGSVGASVGFLDGLLSLERGRTFRLGQREVGSETRIRIHPLRF